MGSRGDRDRQLHGDNLLQSRARSASAGNGGAGGGETRTARATACATTHAREEGWSVRYQAKGTAMKLIQILALVTAMATMATAQNSGASNGKASPTPTPTPAKSGASTAKPTPPTAAGNKAGEGHESPWKTNQGAHPRRHVAQHLRPQARPKPGREEKLNPPRETLGRERARCPAVRAERFLPG